MYEGLCWIEDYLLQPCSREIKGEASQDIERSDLAVIDLHGWFCRISAIGYIILRIEFRSPDLSGRPGRPRLDRQHLVDNELE